MEVWYDPIQSLIRDKIFRSFETEAKVTSVLSRHDGHVVFSFKSDNSLIEEKQVQSISALICGAWQAVDSLKDYFKTSDDEIYRLSFDTSSSGVFVIPLSKENDKYYLSFVYSKLINPGSLKAKLRILKKELEEKLYVNKEAKEDINKYLFENVTDEEVDNLFSFAGV